jgi:NADH-quinone oxidoreductase subunit A
MRLGNFLEKTRGAGLLNQYAIIALYCVIAVAFTTSLIVLPRFLRKIGIIPHHPSAVKNSPFECGMESTGKAQVRFNFRYYFFALMFMALDVLILFLYPWAVGFKSLGWLGLIAVLVMIALVVVGYLHAWHKKVLEWK